MIDYLIVANGPFLAKEIIAEAAKDKIIVVLDGASDRLAKLGIKPHVILGDFDSVNLANSYWGIKQSKDEMPDFPIKDYKELEYTGKYQVKIVPAKDQMYSDLQKAIAYCDEDAKSKGSINYSIEIVCALGARLDHHEANVRVLKSRYQAQRPIYLHNECQTLEFVRDKTIQMCGEVGEYCGVLALQDCTLISDNNGLEWSSDEGKPYELSYGVFDSTSNQLTQKIANITITGDALVVHPGKLQAQRQFTGLSVTEQLKKLLAQEEYQLVETNIAELKSFKESYQKEKGRSEKDRAELSYPNMFYVSNTKQEALSSAQDMPLLVSMKASRYENFRLFKQHYNSSPIKLEPLQGEFANLSP